MGSEVGGVAAARPLGPRGSGAALAVPLGPSGPGVPAQAEEPAVERRLQERRGDERRKQKLPILLEMRVGPRRTARRRAGDGPPPSVDTKA
jgi:hypothetical protein